MGFLGRQEVDLKGRVMRKSTFPSGYGLPEVQGGRLLHGQRWSPRGAHGRSSTNTEVHKFRQSLSADRTMSLQEPRGELQRKALIGKLNVNPTRFLPSPPTCITRNGAAPPNSPAAGSFPKEA